MDKEGQFIPLVGDLNDFSLRAQEGHRYTMIKDSGSGFFTKHFVCFLSQAINFQKERIYPQRDTA